MAHKQHAGWQPVWKLQRKRIRVLPISWLAIGPMRDGKHQVNDLLFTNMCASCSRLSMPVDFAEPNILDSIKGHCEVGCLKVLLLVNMNYALYHLSSDQSDIVPMQLDKN